jgi:4-amino-4-deoxy-L-arabinose transferase-like glycosyltransferase
MGCELKEREARPESAIRSLPSDNSQLNNPQSAIRNPHSIWLPLLLCLVYFLTLAYLARAHTFGTYGTETDFYHFFAPDAERLAAGQFPENPYQGPGYPALLALVTRLTGDIFVAGKWISIISAALVVGLIFLLFARLFGYWVGVGAQLIALVSGEFPQFAISATTDVFFLLLCLATLLVFVSERAAVPWRVALTAVLAALAYLTRYNGLFLVAACLLGIVWLNYFNRGWRDRSKLAALFLAVFFITASPWLYANYRHRGSPFYNTNYLNMATLFYGNLVGGRTNQDGTRRLEDVFHSFGDVLRYDPRRVITHYPVNLSQSLRNSIWTSLVSPWVGWLAAVGLALALIERRSKAVSLVIIAGAIYLLLMGLNHWEARYYFFIMAIYAGLSVYAAFRLLELVRARGLLKHQAFALAPIAFVAVMWWTSFAFARNNVRKFLADHPTEVLAACGYLKSANVQGTRIVARKPHLPYICRQQWVFIPQTKSLDELRAWLEDNPVDYINISQVEISRRRELAVLKDPKNAPAWLKPVWVSADPFCILYAPQLDQEK